MTDATSPGRPRPSGPVRVTVADDCELVTEGLACLLAPYDALTLVPPPRVADWPHSST